MAATQHYALRPKSDLTLLYCFGPVCDRKWPLYDWGPKNSGVESPEGSGKYYNDGLNAFCENFRKAMRWHTEGQSYLPTAYLDYDVPTQQDWNTPVDKVVPEEQWVHNLEHSGVVALYNCPQGCPDLLAKLAAFKQTGVRSKFGYVKLLVQPYDKLPNKLTLVAWNFYLRLADYDEAAVRSFFTTHQDKGPEPDTP